MSTKVCTKCGKEKSLDEFYADKRNTDGKTSWCKTCSKEKSTSWRSDNREHYNETTLNRYHTKMQRKRKGRELGEKIVDAAARNKIQEAELQLLSKIFADHPEVSEIIEELRNI